MSLNHNYHNFYAVRALTLPGSDLPDPDHGPVILTTWADLLTLLVEKDDYPPREYSQFKCFKKAIAYAFGDDMLARLGTGQGVDNGQDTHSSGGAQTAGLSPFDDVPIEGMFINVLPYFIILYRCATNQEAQTRLGHR